MLSRYLAAPLVAACATLCLCAPATAATLYRVTDLGGHLAYAINQSGDVAGSGYEGPFLYSQGQFTSLGSLGGPNGIAFGLNRSRVVVGQSPTPQGIGHAFAYTGSGPMTDIGAFAGADVTSQASAVNDQGMVVGYTFKPVGGNEAFSYAGGQFTPLGRPTGALDSALVGVNAKGQAVGYADIAFPTGHNYAAHAVMYSAGKWKRLGSLSPSPRATSYAQAINDSGQVTGSSNVAEPFGRSHAFLWKRGAMKDLGTLGDANVDTSLGLAINNLGQVVGQSSVGTQTYAFLFDGTRIVDLNATLDASGQGWVLKTAWGINDAGQIVGVGQIGTNLASHGFLLTPVGAEVELPGR